MEKSSWIIIGLIGIIVVLFVSVIIDTKLMYNYEHEANIDVITVRNETNCNWSYMDTYKTTIINNELDFYPPVNFEVGKSYHIFYKRRWGVRARYTLLNMTELER
jgi:GH15 family glucan-1,4-alpha-glucosidase